MEQNIEVYVSYDDIYAKLKLIEEEINLLDQYKTSLRNIAANNTGWQSTAEDIFHKHIKNELVPYLDSIVKSGKEYVRYINTSLKDYKRIDKY